MGSAGPRDRWGDIYANAPVKKMIALYDYDPQELSPNVDAEVELVSFFYCTWVINCMSLREAWDLTAPTYICHRVSFAYYCTGVDVVDHRMIF